MFLRVLLKVDQSEMLNIYSFFKKREKNRKFSLWTKSIIFGIINNGIQKMDFKLVVCVQVKYRN